LTYCAAVVPFNALLFGTMTWMFNRRWRVAD
jgi:hypothetical protein